MNCAHSVLGNLVKRLFAEEKVTTIKDELIALREHVRTLMLVMEIVPLHRIKQLHSN